MAEPPPAWPTLPPKLLKWRGEVLELHRMHSQLRKPPDGSRPGSRCRSRPGSRSCSRPCSRQNVNDASSELRGVNLEREYAPPAELAYEKLLKRAAGLSFAELLRLYFPPSTRVSARDCEQMASWVREVQEVKAAHQHLRSLEEDAKMIEALDTDSSGTISKSEFLQLVTLMGLDRAECRLRFREADVAHAGELSIPRMGAVLQQIRQEGLQERHMELQDGFERGRQSHPSTAVEQSRPSTATVGTVEIGGQLPYLRSQLACPPATGSQKVVLPAM